MECAYVYILASSFKHLYIGFTTKLEQRIWQHKNQTFPNSFTARYRIDQLVYFERYSLITRGIARERTQGLAAQQEDRLDRPKQSRLDRFEQGLGQASGVTRRDNLVQALRNAKQKAPATSKAFPIPC
jgi:predicted GIY-YIG superfamily endonuclease